jgi:hypothetical protein
VTSVQIRWKNVTYPVCIVIVSKLFKYIYVPSFYTELLVLFVMNYIELHIGDVPALMLYKNLKMLAKIFKCHFSNPGTR